MPTLTIVAPSSIATSKSWLIPIESSPPSAPVSAFRLGWTFGFGYFLVAFQWIGFAFLVDAATYLWMMPFAVCGLAAAMAIYWGLAAVAARWAGFAGLRLAAGFAAFLAIAEWLRGHLFTGFPWAVPGLAVDGLSFCPRPRA